MSKTDDFLAHYGVKGMKWGVRKSDDTSKSVSTGKKVAAGLLVGAAGATAYALTRSSPSVSQYDVMSNVTKIMEASGYRRIS